MGAKTQGAMSGGHCIGAGTFAAGRARCHRVPRGFAALGGEARRDNESDANRYCEHRFGGKMGGGHGADFLVKQDCSALARHSRQE